MQVYMLYDPDTKLYYNPAGYPSKWVVQTKGKVWSHKNGPVAVVHQCGKGVIATYELSPVKNTDHPEIGQITLALADGWMGIYENGSLLYQNHDISVADALIAVGLKKYLNVIWVDQEWLERRNSLPKQLETVKLR